MDKNKTIVEYIWMDGKKPTAKLRSKARVLDHEVISVSDIPLWSFDGSSTERPKEDFLIVFFSLRITYMILLEGGAIFLLCARYLIATGLLI